MDIEQLIDETVRHYGCDRDDVRVVRSPYRICPMGAHIDHQLGPVTAMAIDRAVYLAFAPSTDNRVQLSSLTFEGEVDFTLDEIPPKAEDDWGNYPRGAVQAIKSSHTLSRGIVGVTTGQISEGVSARPQQSVAPISWRSKRQTTCTSRRKTISNSTV